MLAPRVLARDLDLDLDEAVREVREVLAVMAMVDAAVVVVDHSCHRQMLAATHHDTKTRTRNTCSSGSHLRS